MDEFRAALEWATDEELRDITTILFHRRFNPLDYLYTPAPMMVQSHDRPQWLDQLDERFRFLAADGMTVLRRQAHQVSYRQVLLNICQHLKIPFTQSLPTVELEAEIFLHLLGRAWESLPKAEQQALNDRMARSLNQSDLAQQLPFSLRHNPLGILLNGSSALAVSSVVRPWILKQIARQVAFHMATYDLARQAIGQGSASLATQVTLRTAYRGVALNTARYAAARSVFAVLGSALWVWFLADLGWRTIATNYGRIIPVVFTLAQIRLTRGRVDGLESGAYDSDFGAGWLGFA